VLGSVSKSPSDRYRERVILISNVPLYNCQGVLYKTNQNSDYPAVARKRRGGRQPLYGEKMVLTNFRLPEPLLDQLDEVRSALGKATLVEVVREALQAYVDEKQPIVQAVTRAREKHRGE
jgi:predicted DNA-binding protein